MYEERAYRRTSRPRDLVCYEVAYKETDLFCCTSLDLKAFIEEKTLFLRNQLEGYIRQRPEFLESLVPIPFDPLAPKIAREMVEATARLGVGPMASVAGAVAEFIGRAVQPMVDEYIIENGGDISLRTRKERKAVVFAPSSPYGGKIAIRLKAREQPFGVCTSSATIGPSLSLGRADAVCVVAESALFADGLATRLGNMVRGEGDIGRALDDAQAFPEVMGVLIIMGKSLGARGEIEIVEI